MTDSIVLNEKQKQIKALTEQGKNVREIAEALEVTPGSVYQNIAKMRDAGVEMPKGKGGRPPKDGPAPEPKATPADNGSVVSVEDHVAAELKKINDRQGEIKAAIEAAQTEQTALNERESVLVKAQKALTPAAS